MSGRPSFFDLRSPVFRPLWRRILVVVLSLGWAVFEFVNGAPGWAMIFAAAGLWCAYQFFVVWDEGDSGPEEERNAENDD